jgi:hypothetical protein
VCRLRRWKIQDKCWQRGVCRLRGWNILNNHERDKRNNMPRVPGELELTQRELGGE